MRGTLVSFSGVKDVGYITTEEGERLRIDASAFAPGCRPRTRSEGLAVSFRLTKGRNGRKVEDVVFVADEAPRRARLRRSGGARS